MNKEKDSFITLSLTNKGHGTFPRHKRMMIALCNRGHKVYWICPEKINLHKNIYHIKLLFNLIPNIAFFGLFIKIFLTSLFNLKTFSKINKIIVVREYDGIALFYNPFLSKCKKFFFSRGDVISILKINWKDQALYKKIIHFFIIRMYPFFQKIMNLRTDIFIFQQKFLKKLYFQRNELKKKNVYILNNDCKNLKSKNNFFIDTKKSVIIGFSTPMFWSCKGLENIVKIINFSKKDDNYHFLVAGDGPHLSLLKKKINPLLKNKVAFLGWQNNIYNFLQKIHLLVIPSNFDSNPNMVLEALSSEKIIFATNIDAHKVILNDNQLLFNKDNIKSLYNKIYEVSNNLKYRTKILKKIKKIKLKHIFDWDDAFNKIIEKC